MEKKIVIINKMTNTRTSGMDRRKVLRLLYSPYSEAYIDYSELFRQVLKKYENEPLVKYELTESDKVRLKENPDYINDIPRYVVRGFDKAVGSEFERKLTNEFYERFQRAETEIVKFINDTNLEYKAQIKYIV